MEQVWLLRIAFVFLLVSIVALICRVAKMGPETKETVFWQHLSMGIGDFSALVVIGAILCGLDEAMLELAMMMCAAGNACYLIASSARWWLRPPAGTVKPGHQPKDVGKQDLPHVAGGKRAE